MQKIKKCFMMFSFIFIALGIFNISFATEGETNEKRADVSKITFEWVTDTEYDHSHLKLKVKNTNLIKENTYCVHLSHNKNEVVNVTDTDSVMGNFDMWTSIIYGYGDETPIEDLIDTIGGDDIIDMVATKGDIYIWICELVGSDYSNPKIIVEAKKIERLAQLPLGKRLVGFFNNETYISSYETEGTKDRKVNIKVGKVTDKSLLQEIKNKEADSLQKLLTYAKSADAVYNNTLPLGETKQTIFDSANIVNDEYYYVYMELDDENGTYYPVEDVSLYQANDSGLNNCLDDLFEWDLEGEETPSKEKEKSSDTTKKEYDDTMAKGKLPQTGIYNIILVISIIFAVGVIFIGMKIRKYKDIE